MQYEETDWQFLKRLASGLGTMLISNGEQSVPSFSFGFSQGEDYIYNRKEYTVIKSIPQYENLKANEYLVLSKLDFTIESGFNMHLGDHIIMHGINTKIYKSVFEMSHGLFRKTFYSRSEKGCLLFHT